MSISKRTTKTGRARYDVRLRKPDGTQYMRTFNTKREAERFETKELATRQQGTWIDPTAGRITFAEWAEEWYETMLLGWRPSTVQRNRVALDQYWLPEFGSSRMSTIGPRQIQQVINGMAAKLKPSTMRSYYGTLRSLFGDAVDADVIGRSPCRGIKLPAAAAAEKRVISPEELHALADEVGPSWRLLIYLGGVMGLRFGEATALRVSDLELHTCQVSVTRAVSEVGGKLHIGPPKTSTSIRTLAMPDPLVDEAETHILEQALAKHDLLFSDANAGPIRRSNFRSRIWEPAVGSVGLDGFTFHSLRHSAATQWMASGVDARTVQHLLGHSDPRLVLRLYAHAADVAVAQAAQRVETDFWPQR